MAQENGKAGGNVPGPYARENELLASVWGRVTEGQEDAPPAFSASRSPRRPMEAPPEAAPAMASASQSPREGASAKIKAAPIAAKGEGASPAPRPSEPSSVSERLVKDKGGQKALDSDMNLDQLLQAHIINKIDGANLYRRMAQVDGNNRQMFEAFAKGELRHGKQLCAAYFLRSGIRFWPRRPSGGQQPYLQRLRARLMEGQELEDVYALLAQKLQEDVELSRIYESLAWEERRQVDALKRVVEEII